MAECSTLIGISISHSSSHESEVVKEERLERLLEPEAVDDYTNLFSEHYLEIAHMNSLQVQQHEQDIH